MKNVTLYLAVCAFALFGADFFRRPCRDSREIDSREIDSREIDMREIFYDDMIIRAIGRDVMPQA